MQALQDAATAITSGDHTAMSAALTPLQAALDQIITAQTTVGARSNRIDNARDDNAELRDAFKGILSNVEDIDVAAVSSEFSQQEQILEANRLVSARLIQQNFLDFFT
jgi:flagellar hook-associated protein 3 FlgL